MNPNNQSTSSIIESELRYRRLFEAAQDGILILDATSGAITDVNPFLIHLLGYSRDEFIGKRLWEVGAFKDVEASKDAFEILKKTKYIRYKDLPLRAKSGKLIQVEFVSNVYMEGEEKVIQCNIRDITERKVARDALLKNQHLLREQSIRDHLTGLYNRRYLEEILERELHRALREKSPLGLIMLDLDHFRHFNNNYGHTSGDAILKEIGIILTNHIRKDDISSRIGGDEFIILLPDASKNVTQKRAERFLEQTRKIQFSYKGNAVKGITASFGVAVFPEDGADSPSLLIAADEALYHAKREGRDRISVANGNLTLL